MAATPADFEGRWKVTSVAGGTDVGGSADPNLLIGSTVTWTEALITDADGTCTLSHPSITVIANTTLEQDWGGQTIMGLSLPPAGIHRAFGKTRTPVFAGGSRGCAQDSVLLDHDHMLFMFDNGFLYVLSRQK